MNRGSMSQRAILIVEDEPIIRMCAAEMVEDAGYLAIEVGDAETAMMRLEAGEPIAAVFTDINLPGGMDGLALAEEVGRRWPEIRILIASGRPAPAACPTSGQTSGKVSFIPKPYGSGEFLAALDSVLTAG